MSHPTMSSLARRGGWWLAVLAAASWCALGAELALPAVAGRAVDAVLAGGSTDPTPWLAGAIGLVVAVIGLETLGDLADGYTGAEATSWLRHRLVGAVLTGSGPGPTARDGGRPRLDEGDTVSRIVANAAEAGQAGPAVVALATVVALPAGSLVALVLIDPWLGLAFAAGALAVALVLRSFAHRATDVVTDYQSVLGTIATRLAEAMAGARTVAAAGTHDREADRILAPLPELRRHGAATWNLLAGAAARGAFAGPLLVVTVVAVGGLALEHGRITPGDLLAATQYASFGAGIGGAVSVLGQFARASAGIRRAREILAGPAPDYGTAVLPPGPGRLELRGVTVREAGGRPLLSGLSLDVPGGSALAVVGRSGTGKSLLAALAARLIDPDEGEVRLDGVALPSLPHDRLRQEVGVAFERPVLVGETIADVVGLGDPAPTPEGIRAALSAAHAERFVDRLPAGLRTALTDAPLSGGERQRLGLARAWRGRRLLVLDDATSSLDTATEMQIARALTSDAGRRTRLVVAHRASTAARADAVAWLDGGRLRAVGSHARLWDDPDYRAAFQAGQPG